MLIDICHRLVTWFQRRNNNGQKSCLCWRPCYVDLRAIEGIVDKAIEEKFVQLAPTRITLLERLKNQDDNDAWSEFVQLYRYVIIRWAKELGCSEALSHDVFQETMVSLLRIMPEFQLRRDKGHFRSFLKTIVVRRVSDLWRRERRMVTGEDVLDMIEKKTIDNHRPISSELDSVWLEGILAGVLCQVEGKVASRTFESFQMFAIENMEAEEVASRLGVKKNVIYQHKSRMLDIIRRELEHVLEEFEEIPKCSSDCDRFVKEGIEKILCGGRAFRKTIMLATDAPELGRIAAFRQYLNTFPQHRLGQHFIGVVDPPEGCRWEEVAEVVSLGRSPQADVRLSVDGVSRLHAELRADDAGCRIIDLGSTNGTFVNTQRANDRYLNSGDFVQIGGQTLVYLCVDKGIMEMARDND